MNIQQYGEMGTIKSLIIDGIVYARVFINENYIWYKPTMIGFEALVEDGLVDRLEAAYTEAYAHNEICYVPRTRVKAH